MSQHHDSLEEEPVAVAPEPLEQVPSEDSEVAEYKSRWQRSVADLENLRKRTELDRVMLRQSAAEGIISELLPVVDNFYRATEHVPAEQKDSAWLTGIMYIQKQLVDVLEAQGVTEIAAKDGDEFDPAVHEAISHEQNPDLDNKIKVLFKGYTLNGKLLRPVRVTVYSKEIN
jgi:molecular chaperone GrpE